MSDEYIEIQLYKYEKAAILEHADFVIFDDVTRSDLNNGRQKWIRFTSFDLPQILSELAYAYQQIDDAATQNMLEELMGSLDNHVRG